MKILISNDDGYFAPGIKALAKALAKKHDVRIVAPMSERSGSGHSVSFFSGITYENKGDIDGIPTYAVSGSPGDCVLFGVKYLFKDEKIDAVVSGINTCLNAGSDIIFRVRSARRKRGLFSVFRRLRCRSELTVCPITNLRLSLPQKISKDFCLSQPKT